MADIPPIHSLKPHKHYVLDEFQPLATPTDHHYRSHKDQGQDAFPEMPDSYYEKLSYDSGMGHPDQSYIDESLLSGTIKKVALWTAHFVSIEANERFKALQSRVCEVNKYTQQGLKRQREHINELGPNLSDSISKLPEKILKTKQFTQLKKEVENNQKTIEELELELELLASKEQHAQNSTDLKKEIQDLKEVVAALQRN